jgi:hypothetical protein
MGQKSPIHPPPNNALVMLSEAKHLGKPKFSAG